MGDLFLSFNPQTEVIFEFSGNWLAALSVLLVVPQGYWLVKGQYEKFFLWIIELFVDQLRPIFGKMVSPGSFLILLSMFVFVIMTNFLGLMPYVFTSSSHLSFTLSLALPLWLGKMVLSVIKQLNYNLAHLVPEGTPGALMPVMVIIETVSLVIRPGTLAVRLAANMVAGHLLLVLLGGQGASLGGLVLIGLMIGLVLLVTLECAVACIQAYVFTILSSLYLSEHSSLSMSKMGE
uniref:ATP synthase F0 subunit 6 n=1 Tax=Labidocera rotunda TaxID=207950 RepID=UPI002037162B|nr:ATP synthase F0 subunit 6 [Labidocera rotunda]URC16613.1 ATP synthase F0 subunit 6 [Labidocera rotunda]